MKKIFTSILKKPVVAGMALGIMLTTIASAGAMTTNVVGELHTKNPLLSAPKGYAYTMGSKKITAKCSATKNGKTNSQSVSKKNGGSIETDWVKGPTFSSEKTKFKSTHTGYTALGEYRSISFYLQY